MLQICVCGKHLGSNSETVWAFRCKVVGPGAEGRSPSVLVRCRRPSRRPVEEMRGEVTLVQAKLEQTVHQEPVAVVSVALMSGTSRQPIRCDVSAREQRKRLDRRELTALPISPPKLRLKGRPFFVNPFLLFKHHDNHALFQSSNHHTGLHRLHSFSAQYSSHHSFVTSQTRFSPAQSTQKLLQASQETTVESSPCVSPSLLSPPLSWLVCRPTTPTEPPSIPPRLSLPTPLTARLPLPLCTAT